MGDHDRERIVVTDDRRGGSGGTTVAVVLAIIALLVVLFLIFGRGWIGGGGEDIKADVDISAPAEGS